MHQNYRIITRLFMFLIISVMSVRSSCGQTTNGIRLNIRLLPVQTLIVNAAQGRKDAPARIPVTEKVTAFNPGGYQVMIKTVTSADAGKLLAEATPYNEWYKQQKRKPVLKENNGTHDDHSFPDLNTDSITCKYMFYTVTTR